MMERRQDYITRGTMDEELGDKRHENMKKGSENRKFFQFPTLVGPTGIGWIIDEDYSVSAQWLTEVHREQAFLACVETKKWDYARYLGLHLDFGFRNEHKAAWLLVVKKTRKGPIAKMMGNRLFMNACREYLRYLGKLHVLLVRCLENNVLLSGTVRDLREIDLDELESKLSDVPGTNEVDPYDEALKPFVAERVSRFASKWLRQEDEQVNKLNKALGIR